MFDKANTLRRKHLELEKLLERRRKHSGSQTASPILSQEKTSRDFRRENTPRRTTIDVEEIEWNVETLAKRFQRMLQGLGNPEQQQMGDPCSSQWWRYHDSDGIPWHWRFLRWRTLGCQEPSQSQLQYWIYVWRTGRIQCSGPAAEHDKQSSTISGRFQSSLLSVAELKTFILRTSNSITNT